MRKRDIKIFALLMAIVVGMTFLLTACTENGGNDNNTVANADEYALTVNYNDGASRPFVVYIEKGKVISGVDTPLRTGYTFSKWTSAADGGDDIAFPLTLAADTAIYAQWNVSVYDVTFDFNLGDDAATAQTTEYVKQVEYNGYVVEADAAAAAELLPERKDYVFSGRWQNAAGEFVGFAGTGYLIRREAKFFAYWREADTKVFSVTFDGNYDEAGEPTVISDIEEGSSVELKEVPELKREGFDLKGWATTKNATEPDVTFPYTPEDTVTLYAVWKRPMVKVRFRDNIFANVNHNYIDEQEVESGTEMAAPTAPTRTGFDFLGWYTTATGGEKIEFPFTPTATINLYAHWQSVNVKPAGNKFDAEFVPIVATERFPGYSGATNGTGIIQADESGEFHAYSDPYPTLNGTQSTGHFVTYLYKKGAKLTFNIYSPTALNDVPLYVCMSCEAVEELTIEPTGDYGYQFVVNGESLDYDPIELICDTNIGTIQVPAYEFAEYYVADVNLKAGWNVIELITNNETSPGGTMGATAPMIDYIRFDTTTQLEWKPEYDNLCRDA